MSEYQYYEFLALDRPLTAEQQAQVRALSSRVRPTPFQAVFTYSYGDFRGDPLAVLAQHFDMLLYLANWGSKQLAFRLPRAVIDPDVLRPYAFAADEIEMTTTANHIILSLDFHEEGGQDWIEGEGHLSALVPLRAALMRGDRRVLYLAWLKAAAGHAGWLSEEKDDRVRERQDEWEVAWADADEAVADEDREDVDADWTPPPDRLIEPPVPPGLGQLDVPHQAFVDLFGIDADLLTVAATASPALVVTAEPFERWVTLLPVAERDAFLVGMARDEPHAAETLRHRLWALGGSAAATPATEAPRRSLATLLSEATERREARRRQARLEAEAARRRHLSEIARQEPALWAQVTALIEQKTVQAYDKAVAILVELQALADDRGQMTVFADRLEALRQTYQRRPGLLQRLRQAELG